MSKKKCEMERQKINWGKNDKNNFIDETIIMIGIEEIIQDQKYFRKIDKRKLQANEQELRRDLKNGGKKTLDKKDRQWVPSIHIFNGLKF